MIPDVSDWTSNDDSDRNSFNSIWTTFEITRCSKFSLHYFESKFRFVIINNLFAFSPPYTVFFPSLNLEVDSFIVVKHRNILRHTGFAMVSFGSLGHRVK